MAIVVRQADITADRQILIDFLYQHLTKQSDDRRFDWLYRNNPYGTASAWLALDKGNGAVAGVAAAFPRLIQVQGEDLVCWNLGDFVIDSNFRSLGPALLLQRACLVPVLDGRVPFCYDYPSGRMMAIYKRLGIQETGRVVRFVKPLRVDRQVSTFVGESILSQGISAVGNSFLALTDRQPRLQRDYETTLHEDSFGDEFSKLDHRLAGRFAVCGHRTAEYLNWRYRNNPLCLYEIITVRQKGNLTAYAIFTRTGQDAVLAELFGEQEPKVVEVLLAAVVEVLRQRKTLTLSAPVLDSNPFIPFLKQAGFYPREHSPVVVCTQAGGHLDGVVNEGRNWFLTHGDRDS